MFHVNKNNFIVQFHDVKPEDENEEPLDDHPRNHEEENHQLMVT